MLKFVGIPQCDSVRVINHQHKNQYEIASTTHTTAYVNRTNTEANTKIPRKRMRQRACNQPQQKSLYKTPQKRIRYRSCSEPTFFNRPTTSSNNFSATTA